MRPWSSPGSTVRSTSRRTVRSPNVLETLRTSSREATALLRSPELQEVLLVPEVAEPLAALGRRLGEVDGADVGRVEDARRDELLRRRGLAQREAHVGVHRLPAAVVAVARAVGRLLAGLDQLHRAEHAVGRDHLHLGRAARLLDAALEKRDEEVELGQAVVDLGVLEQRGA